MLGQLEIYGLKILREVVKVHLEKSPRYSSGGTVKKHMNALSEHTAIQFRIFVLSPAVKK
jgi:hypothetical protein